MSDRDGILDIHGKCRREREELEARLAWAERERDSLARRCAVRYEETEKLRAELHYALPVVEAARAYRKASDALRHFDARKDNLADCADAHVAARLALAAALDAYGAADVASPVAAPGRTSNEDAADVGAACTCPEVWAGTRRTGSRNLSPSCAQHGEGTGYWRDFWTAQAALGSPRERAERLRAEKLAADSRAGQAGEEVAGT